MSTVYRGVDLRLDRPVAVKIMSPQYVTDPTFLGRFEREARVAAGLGHSGVVAVFDQGRDGDLVFLVMELVDGGTLRDLLRERHTLSVPVTLVHPRAAARRPGRGPRRRARAPRREAGERPALREGRGQDRRLRPGPRRELADDGHRRRHPRHRRIPVPRAGRDRGVGRPVRRVLGRHRRVRDAHRRPAVRRRQPDVGRLPARALRCARAVAARRRHPGGARRADRRRHPPGPGGAAAGCRGLPLRRRPARGPGSACDEFRCRCRTAPRPPSR